MHRRMPGIAVVTTLRNAGDVLATWLHYHRAVGVDHFFLFFDDPLDPSLALVEGRDDVTCFRRDEALRATQRGCPVFAKIGASYDTELIARQMLDTSVAIARAKAMGFEWLFHIDSDELLYSNHHDIRRHVVETLPGLAQLKLVNHEAVPEAEELAHPFRDASLFVLNPSLVGWPPADSFWGRRGWVFNAYENGKAAVRLSADPEPLGPHDFGGADGRPLATLRILTISVLHYPNAGLRRFRQKYRTLGRFPDQWFDGVPHTVPFHLAARDVVHDGTDDDIREFYRTHVMLGGLDVDAQLRAKRMFRLHLPAYLLGTAA